MREQHVLLSFDERAVFAEMLDDGNPPDSWEALRAAAVIVAATPATPPW